MPRLVAFGCSYTQGIGLSPDMAGPTAGPNNSRKSPLAWPQLTADLLGLTCVNEGFGGTSPKATAHIISEFDFQSDDTVVIMWPVRHRWCVLLEDIRRSTKHICPGDVDDLPMARAYYEELYSERDSMFMFKAWCTYADTLCKSKASKVVHTISDTDGEIDSYEDLVPEVTWISGFRDNPFDKLNLAPDGHWAPECHVPLANKLSTYISQM
jgi:hypothetical protein